MTTEDAINKMYEGHMKYRESLLQQKIDNNLRICAIKKQLIELDCELEKVCSEDHTIGLQLSLVKQQINTISQKRFEIKFIENARTILDRETYMNLIPQKDGA